MTQAFEIYFVLVISFSIVISCDYKSKIKCTPITSMSLVLTMLVTNECKSNLYRKKVFIRKVCLLYKLYEGHFKVVIFKPVYVFEAFDMVYINRNSSLINDDITRNLDIFQYHKYDFQLILDSKLTLLF